MQRHKKIWWLLAVVGLFFISVDEAKAQRIAVSTNSLEWLTLFTINLSKHYLADTEMSVKEIADTLHFPDQSTFGRYFKQHMGCSPGEYRRGVKLLQNTT